MYGASAPHQAEHGAQFTAGRVAVSGAGPCVASLGQYTCPRLDPFGRGDFRPISLGRTHHRVPAGSIARHIAGYRQPYRPPQASRPSRSPPRQTPRFRTQSEGPGSGGRAAVRLAPVGPARTRTGDSGRRRRTASDAAALTREPGTREARHRTGRAEVPGATRPGTGRVDRRQYASLLPPSGALVLASTSASTTAFTSGSQGAAEPARGARSQRTCPPAASDGGSAR